MKTLLEETIKFVDESFGGKKPHYVQTLFWLLQLKPNANDALKIAAYSHDIERAFKRKTGDRIRLIYENPEHLVEHQKKSGQIMHDFLMQKGVSEKLAREVKELISKHEVGGTEDQNLLKDADSLSYLEVNAPRHLKMIGEIPEAEIREKFNWMHERITFREAKELAKPFFNDVMGKLDKAK